MPVIGSRTLTKVLPSNSASFSCGSNGDIVLGRFTVLLVFSCGDSSCLFAISKRLRSLTFSAYSLFCASILAFYSNFDFEILQFNNF